MVEEAIEEGIRNTNSRVLELMNSHLHLRKTVKEIGDQFGHLQNTMEMFMAEFQRNFKGKATASSGEVNFDTPNDFPRTIGFGCERNTRNISPGFDLPVFNGLDIKNWIMKCDFFFQFYPMNDEQKLKSVALNVEGEAGTWFLAYYKTNPNISWIQFVEDIEVRYGDSAVTSALAKFNRLQQTTTVFLYQKRFEFLKALVGAENPGLTEDYFVKCFIGGLREEIAGFVKLLKPQKLSEAISAARVQECTVEAIYRKTKPTTFLGKHGKNSSQGSEENSSQESALAQPGLTGDRSNFQVTMEGHKCYPGHVKKFTYDEIQARKDKGLCFSCEFYKPGHKCKNKQVFMLIGEEELDEGEFSWKNEEQLEFDGNTSDTTVRIKAKVGSKEIIILIDTGSTHNFLKLVFDPGGMECILRLQPLNTLSRQPHQSLRTRIF